MRVERPGLREDAPDRSTPRPSAFRHCESHSSTTSIKKITLSPTSRYGVTNSNLLTRSIASWRVSCPCPH
jgi:hypothetical protein